VAVQLGVLYEPAIPLVQVLVIAAGTFVAAALVAVGPAWAAGLTPPVTVLRSEQRGWRVASSATTPTRTTRWLAQMVTLHRWSNQRPWSLGNQDPG
jgi:hypothetical protein